MMPSRSATLAVLCTGLLSLIVSADSATAGWPFWKSAGCSAPVEAPCYECPQPAKKTSPKEPKDPPEGPVVSSIPAIMLPQMAIAVPPQRINAAMATAEDERAERLLKLLERLEARQSGTAAAAAAAVPMKSPEERLEELLIELQKLKEELRNAPAK